jgi:hypothetical protein
MLRGFSWMSILDRVKLKAFSFNVVEPSLRVFFNGKGYLVRRFMILNIGEYSVNR